MKKLVRSTILVTLLLGVMLFVQPSSGNNPPVLQNLFFNKSQATVNEDVLLSLNITDDFNEIDYVYVGFYWYNSSHTDYINTYYPNFNSDSQYWEVVITIGQYWELGWYYIDYIYAEDKDGNYMYAFNGTDYISPEFEVYGTTPDSNPPVLEDLWFNQQSATVDDEVVLYANLSDDVSGVDYVYAEIYWYNSTGDYGVYKLGNSLTNNGTDIFAFSFIVGQYWINGTYYVHYMSISDIAGNYISLYNSSNEIPTTELDVQGTTPDINPPVVQWVEFNQPTGTPDEEIEVRANITDDVSGVYYVYATLFWYNESAIYDWDHLSVLHLDLYNNGTEGIFTNTFIVNQYWRSGTYYIGEMNTADHAYNWAYYQNGTDYPSGELEVSGTTPDFDPPQFHSIWTNTDSSAAGSYFDVFVNATDDLAGVMDGWISFEYYSSTDDTWYWATDGWLYYNPDTQLLEGQILTPDWDEIIGQRITSSYLEIYDQAGNSLYLDAHMGDFAPISLEVTQRQKSDFNLSIDPSEGTSNIGQSVHFSIIMENLFSHNVEGKLAVRVSGAENFDVFIGETHNFGPSELITRNLDLSFSSVGEYEIIATFDVEGQVFQAIAKWIVNEGDEQIKVTVDPNDGQSSVDETVTFKVVVKSSFVHEMSDVSLIFEGSSTSGEGFNEEVMVTLPSQSSISESFNVSFKETGEYTVRAILIDDIGEEWSFEFFWNVVDGDDPEIELPGFELPFALVSLFAMSAIITIRRKNLF